MVAATKHGGSGSDDGTHSIDTDIVAERDILQTDDRAVFCNLYVIAYLSEAHLPKIDGIVEAGIEGILHEYRLTRH